MGFFIGGAIVMGVVGGLWLDSKLNSDLFWVVGLILGVIFAFWGVYRMLLPLIYDKRGKDKENS